MKMNNIRHSIETAIKKLSWDINPDKITQLLKSCIGGASKVTTTNCPLGTSKLGGLPHLPKDCEWPEIKGMPLAFIGQINFSELKDFSSFDPVFENKIIYFFFLVDYTFYEKEHPDQHRIIIADIDQISSFEPVPFPQKLEDTARFEETGLEFSESFCFPSYQYWEILDLNLSHNDDELLWDVYEIIQTYTKRSNDVDHQLFGYAEAIQGDVNIHWAGKNKKNKSLTEDAVTIQKQFELLFQVNTEDKNTNFTKAVEGGIYYGYKKSEPFTIECVQQNT